MLTTRATVRTLTHPTMTSLLTCPGPVSDLVAAVEEGGVGIEERAAREGRQCNEVLHV